MSTRILIAIGSTLLLLGAASPAAAHCGSCGVGGEKSADTAAKHECKHAEGETCSHCDKAAKADTPCEHAKGETCPHCDKAAKADTPCKHAEGETCEHCDKKAHDEPCDHPKGETCEHCDKHAATDDDTPCEHHGAKGKHGAAAAPAQAES